MIKNYLKTAYRSLLKNKGFTLLNVFGLSIGLAVCLLILFYVVNELNYDKYNTKADRIYRITESARLNDHEGTYASSAEPFIAEMKQFPQVEKFARMLPTADLFLSPSKYFVRKGQENIEERNIVYTESSLFDVFTLPMIDGTPSKALDDPHTAVITESIAKKYFGKTNVVGQTLKINDTSLYKVTGVIKDIPSQSHFHYDFFLSYSSIPESHSHGWGYEGMYNYLLLKPGTDVHRMETEMRKICIKNSFDPKAWTTGSNYVRIELTPLLDIHLRSHTVNALEPGGEMQYVYIFSVIGILILLTACVNFMNLSTARSANRAKEVGVRKVLGSARKYLIAQFLTESMLITFVSALIALALSTLLLPLFNEVAGKQLVLNNALLIWIVPLLLFITLIIGLLAGSYPAFFLSGFRPIEVLKGKLATGFKGGGSLRSLLVVFQFSISIFLIIGTIVIYHQLNFIHNTKLGFDRSQVLIIKNTGGLGKRTIVLNDELKRLPGIVNTSVSSYVPTGRDRNNTGLFPQLPIDIKQDVLSEFWPVDENYLNTMGIKLVSGRNFSKELASDTTAMIVNEAFVTKFGFKNPLGKIIYRDSYGIQAYHIVGVMKDFHFSSLHDKIGPCALVCAADYGAISVKVKTADLPGLMSKIEDKWKQFSPNMLFNYSFMDEDFDATYRSEQRLGTLFISFSTLAILIACLGLFGLAAYAAEQRNKEIGIRKVLGASVSGIVGMLSMDFIKLVLISIFIASPVAWWAMNKWLENFAYRMNIPWWVIALAGFTAIFIAFVTISFQSIRAAVANPVKSLRSE